MEPQRVGGNGAVWVNATLKATLQCLVRHGATLQCLVRHGGAQPSRRDWLASGSVGPCDIEGDSPVPGAAWRGAAVASRVGQQRAVWVNATLKATLQCLVRHGATLQCLVRHGGAQPLRRDWLASGSVGPCDMEATLQYLGQHEHAAARRRVRCCVAPFSDGDLENIGGHRWGAMVGGSPGERCRATSRRAAWRRHGGDTPRPQRWPAPGNVRSPATVPASTGQRGSGRHGAGRRRRMVTATHLNGTV